MSLTAALKYLTTDVQHSPPAAAVVSDLLAAEKQLKHKVPCTYEALVGRWRLGFITGTRRSRQRAGAVLGAGRFIPSWISIQLAYVPSEAPSDEAPDETRSALSGTVENTVQWGGVTFRLTGPTRFYAQGNILAFDFTRLTLCLWGWQAYQGFGRGGQEREARFASQALKDQAFFTYFLVTPDYVAARGRGGGLALWVRAPD